MYLYGFELEGFYRSESGVEPPPLHYPTDGFPGLVELRTTGGHPLKGAYSDIVKACLETPGVVFGLTAHRFSREHRAILRRRHNEKTAWDIRNLYGKNPRLLGDKTLASCQINISNQISSGYIDDKGVRHLARYGVLDVPRIVRNLDDEFATEIKAARRQPGEYAIKGDHRLEYRSLPNSVFSFDLDKARIFLQRVQAAVEEF